MQVNDSVVEVCVGGCGVCDNDNDNDNDSLLKRHRQNKFPNQYIMRINTFD